MGRNVHLDANTRAITLVDPMARRVRRGRRGMLDIAAFRAQQVWAAPQIGYAQQVANAAMDRVNAIGADGMLDRSEKSQAIIDYNELDASLTDLVPKANAAGVSYAAFNAAMTALANYLLSLAPAWNTLGTDSPIVPATWMTVWQNAYTEQGKLLAAIADKARVKADSALADLAHIGSDGWLSRSEKPQAVIDYNELDQSLGDLSAKASAASISYGAFAVAMNALANYLISLNPGWADTSQDSAIDATTWYTRWKDAYTERSKLISAIADKAQRQSADAGGGNLIKNADWNQGDATRPTGYQLYAVSNTNPSMTTSRTAGAGALPNSSEWRFSLASGTTSRNFGFYTEDLSEDGGIVPGFINDQWYTVSFYARAGGGFANNAFQLVFNCGPNEMADVLKPALTGEWQRYAFAFRYSKLIKTTAQAATASSTLVLNDASGVSTQTWADFVKWQVWYGGVQVALINAVNGNTLTLDRNVTIPAGTGVVIIPPVESNGRFYVALNALSTNGWVAYSNVQCEMGRSASGWGLTLRTAMDDLARIGSDGWLSKGEKPQAMREWNALGDERWNISPTLYDRAVTAGVDPSAYVTAIDNLAALLTYTASWNNVSIDSQLTVAWDGLSAPATWEKYWRAAYIERNKLASAVASLAAANAATALADLAKIGSDGWLSKGEKPAVQLEWQALWNEYYSASSPATTLGSRATAMGLDAGPYTTAIGNLISYYTGLSPSATDTTVDTPIVPATWIATWQAAYTERNKLASALAERAKLQGDAAARQGDNLIPNGDFELPDLLGLAGSAGSGIEDAAGAGYGGSTRCVKIVCDGGGYGYKFMLTNFPCQPGDTFEMGAMIKGAIGGSGTRVAIDAFDSSGGNHVYGTTPWVSNANYTQSRAIFTIPTIDGIVRSRMNVYVEASSTAGAIARCDNVYLKRAMVKDTPLGLPTWRALQAISGSETGGYAYWRGNDDPNVRGGAPDIYRLNLMQLGGTFDSTRQFTQMYYRATITPTTFAPGSDNIDTLKTLRMKLYTGGGALIDTVSVACPGRTYAGTGEIAFDFSIWQRGATSQMSSTTPFLPMAYLRCCLTNVYGTSAELDYEPGTVFGTNMARKSPSPIIGGTPGGSAGGGDDGTGCPVEWVKLDLANADQTGPGGQKEAKDIVPGDWVWTVPEDGGEYGAQEVTSVEPDVNDIGALRVAYLDRPVDIIDLHFAWNHRFDVRGKGWVEMNALAEGDIIEGRRPARVVKTEFLCQSPVVRITVDGARTYETWGLRSHNVKRL